jgi:hypothetical protein
MQSLDELNNGGVLGLQQAFHDQLALSIPHCCGDGGLMNVHADILFLTHKGVLFAKLVVRTITTYRKSGRLFILRVMTIFATLVHL